MAKTKQDELEGMPQPPPSYDVAKRLVEMRLTQKRATKRLQEAMPELIAAMKADSLTELSVVDSEGNSQPIRLDKTERLKFGKSARAEKAVSQKVDLQ